MSKWESLRRAGSRLVRSKFVLPISDSLGRDTRIEDGYVLIVGDQIEEVGRFSPAIRDRIFQEHPNVEVLGSYDNRDVPCHNGVLLPSFIKAHGHDHESPIIGVAKDVPLTTWLDDAVNIFVGFLGEFEDELTRDLGMSPYKLAYLKAKLDDTSYGITAAMTHHCGYNKFHVPEMVDAVVAAGVSCYVAVGAQDRNFDPRCLIWTPEEAIANLDENYELFKDLAPKVKIVPGPDQFFSNGPEQLKLLKQWADDHDVLFHIHSSEERATTEWFTETYGMSPVEYGYDCGVLDENSVLAHQVQTTENDLRILVETGTKIVHNPLANTILGSGMPPILDMLDAGVPIAISTDGSGSADNQNIIAAARCASQYQKAYYKDATVLPAQQVLEMITIEPANILGMNKGSLEAGKDADMVLFDLNSLNLTPTHIETVVENLIWAANGDEISHVWCEGEMLVEDYRLKRVDEEDVKKAIRKLGRAFLDYKATGVEIRGTGVHT